jgi:6,7-dimethyl-8-ribityllumazine synthase
MGLANKLKAYAIQDELKLDTIDANLHVGFHTDTRDYAEIVEIIRAKLEIESIILYSNNPEKQTSLAPVVAKVEALAFKANEHNKKYLETKKERMRHKTVMDTMQWDKEAVEAKTGEGEKKRVCVIAARWNADFVEPLLNECMAELEEKKAEVSMYRVPGALDLLAAARTVLKKKDTKVDAIVLIGVLIKGESDGYSAACNSLATGISQLNSSSEFNVPVISGLLMCQDEGQAEERCADHKLGAGFALEALEMVTLTKSL